MKLGKSNHILEHVILIGAFIWMGVYLIKPIHSADVWWRLATGRYIHGLGVIPRVDVFSLSCRGHTWTEVEWLYDWVLFRVFQYAGLCGILGLKIGLILATMALVLKRLELYGTTQAEQVGGMLAVFWASRQGWGERADLVSLFFIALLFLCLENNRIRKAPLRSLWYFPFIFLVWADLHPGFILGLGMLCVYGIEAVRENPQNLKTVFIGCLLCVAATVATPFGLQLHRAIVRALLLASHVDQTEFQWTSWKPMQFFWGCMGLLWMALARAAKKNVSLPWTLGGVAVLLSWSAIRHIRYVPFFMVGAFPYAIACGVTDPLILQFRRQLARLKPWGSVLIVLSLVLWIAQAVSQASLGLAPENLPVGACDFIASHALPGPFYNEYNFGSYWIWRFAGHPPVFVDGRSSTVDGYPSLREEIRRAKEGSPEDWNAFLDRYHITAALMNYPGRTPFPSVYRIYFPRTRWALVYWDDVSLLFLKRTSDHRKVIAANEFKDLSPEIDEQTLVQQLKGMTLSQRQCLKRELMVNTQRQPHSRRAQRMLGIVQGTL